tara:strand:- start:1279 stop:1395 length:117 start_codon:yes stop_codon:yes gene_type:complete
MYKYKYIKNFSLLNNEDKVEDADYRSSLISLLCKGEIK